jgi:hypothetical protein
MTIINDNIFISKKAIIFYASVVIFLLHIITNHIFKIRTDELYFVICGNHLSFGYVDQAPFVPFVAKISSIINPKSLFVLRLFPALISAATIIIIGLLVIELEGGRYSLILAMLCYIISPAYFRSQNMLHVTSFEPFFWLIILFLLIKLIKTKENIFWIPIGIFIGFGFLNKPTIILIFGFIIIFFIINKNYYLLFNKWFYLSIIIFLIIISPFIFWQFLNSFPMIEFIQNLQKNSLINISYFEFITGQILYIHPFNFFISIIGLYYFLFYKKGKIYNIFGYLFIFLLVFFLIFKAKVYYIAPFYCILFSSGSIYIEIIINKYNLKYIKKIILITSLLSGIIIIPLIIPLLPNDILEKYTKSKIYDLYGTLNWEEYVIDVAKYYNNLETENKKNCLILAYDYGIASAINYFKENNIPEAVSGNMNYYLWGVGKKQGTNILAVGFDKSKLSMIFKDIVFLGKIKSAKWTGNEDIFKIHKNKEFLKKYIIDRIENDDDKEYFLLKFKQMDNGDFSNEEIRRYKKDSRLMEILIDAFSTDTVFLCTNPNNTLNHYWYMLKKYQ